MNLKRYHQELWNWLSENPHKQKEDWPGWEYNEVKELQLTNFYVKEYQCFACAHRDYLENVDLCGKTCPVKWGEGNNGEETPCTLDEESTYDWWTILRFAGNLEERSKVAKIIADSWIGEEKLDKESCDICESNPSYCDLLKSEIKHECFIRDIHEPNKVIDFAVQFVLNRVGTK